MFIYTIPPEIHWTQYLSAIVPGVAVLIVGIITGCIAWRQWKTAHERLKLDLFEKRLSIYKATIDYMGSVISNENISIESLTNFTMDTSEVKWLFNDEMEKYLHKEIRGKIIALRTNLKKQEAYKLKGVPEELIDKQDEYIEWLEKEISALDEKFSPFLRIKV